MTRCTCLWTAEAGHDPRMTVMLADPLCPATAVHERTAVPTSCPCRAPAEGHRVCLPA